MSERKFFGRIWLRFQGLPSLGLLSVGALLVFWACRVTNEEAQDHFDLKVDSAWLKCDSLIVILQDEKGKTLDTLFKDSISAIGKLSNLPADKYAGGTAQVRIIGRKAGGLCLDQSRTFDDKGGPVIVDTVALPNAPPKSVAIAPSELEISVGDPDFEVVASIKPAYAKQAFEWSVEDASIATLAFPNGEAAGKVMVVPLKNGTVTIHARAKNDKSLSAELLVKVGSVSGKTIDLAPDSLKIFLGGPDTSLIAKVTPENTGSDIRWSSEDVSIATVNDQGMVHAIHAGTTRIKARFGDAAASAVVQVKWDAPVLTVASKSGAAVNASIVFSPKATQEFGSIVMYKWDLQGDGNWDDSLPGPFLGTTVDLPPQTAKFSAQGTYSVGFMVRDSEGNISIVYVDALIGDQPPEVVSITHDTAISVKDSLGLSAKVRDLEGKVAWIGWDFEGDGKFDDTAKANDSVAELKSGHRYNAGGVFFAVLRAVDDNGKARLDSVTVKVLLDAPVADAGKDTTVIAGTAVNFHAAGKDSLGTIAKRELKVGAGPYLNLGKQDTTFKLAQDSGSVTCVVRVTDDDGNSDEDTMIVTIVAPDKSNNQLAGLVASYGVLTPTFKPVTIIYSLAVAYPDSQVSITATTFDPAATFAVNGKPVANGTPCDPVDVKVGTSNEVFKIVVTAEDGNQRIYSVSVVRAPSADARLSKLDPVGFSLKPGFDPAVLDYADTVAFSVGSVTLKPTPFHPAAKVTVNDSLVASGTASKPQSLEAGDNLIKVAVTAQDGKTKSAYNIKVVRRTKLILNRVAGGGTTARTDSSEYPPGFTTTIKSPDTVGFHFTKWIITAGTATLADSTANPAELTIKSGPVRVLAVWAVNSYNISTSISGFVGGAFNPVNTVIQHGKDTSVTVTPLLGYRMLSLTDNGTAVNTLGAANGFGVRTYNFTNVIEKHKLVATFLKTYTLTSSVSGNGTITPSGTVEVDSGSSKEYALASGSTATGVIVSSLLDNTVESVGAVTGDPMAASKYTLTGIKENHTLAAAFSVKVFTMKVYGHKLCVNRVTTCVPTTGSLCLINLCLVNSGPDSTTIAAPYGASYTITTSDTLGTRNFLGWTKEGTSGYISTASSFTSPVITSDVTFRANYQSIIICCIIIDPPIGPLPILADPVLQMQKSPAAP